MSVNYKWPGGESKYEDTQWMSQAFLAEQVELSVSYVSCIERAQKQVSLESLVRIANSLDTRVDSLLIRSQPMTFWRLPPDGRSCCLTVPVKKKYLCGYPFSSAKVKPLHRNG